MVPVFSLELPLPLTKWFNTRSSAFLKFKILLISSWNDSLEPDPLSSYPPPPYDVYELRFVAAPPASSFK